MVNALTLLLPCLFPSWAFFRTVEPSPRVQWRPVSARGDPGAEWRAFRPRPARVSIWAMILRLFWNSQWSETLYLVSLSERVILTPGAHSVGELEHLIGSALSAMAPAGQTGCAAFQFRLVFVHREGGQILEEVCFVSAPCAVPLGAQ